MADLPPPHARSAAAGAVRRPLLLFAIALLAACGGGGIPHAARSTNAAEQDASTRLGDVVLRANAIPTTALNPAIARQYGIAAGATSVMLLVSVRTGPEAHETALAARVTATATDLLGKRQIIAIREVRSGEFVDYVGTAEAIKPETLRFDVTAVPARGAALTLQFNRDFFPD